MAITGTEEPVGVDISATNAAGTIKVKTIKYILLNSSLKWRCTHNVNNTASLQFTGGVPVNNTGYVEIWEKVDDDIDTIWTAFNLNEITPTCPITAELDVEKTFKLYIYSAEGVEIDSIL